jgi:hypothetical protein
MQITKYMNVHLKKNMNKEFVQETEGSNDVEDRQ